MLAEKLLIYENISWIAYRDFQFNIVRFCDILKVVLRTNIYDILISASSGNQAS